MDSTVLENFFKRNEEMLGSLFGQMGRIEEKLVDLEERFSTFEDNSGSRPPLSEVGPTISVGDEDEDIRIFKKRVPGKMTEYLTAPDEVHKEDPLPITHKVVCYHLHSILHLTVFCNN